MDQRATQRQTEIRSLIDSDTLTLEQARAALRSLLDVAASAQAGPDVTSYGIDGSFPREVVDAGRPICSDCGQPIDPDGHDCTFPDS